MRSPTSIDLQRFSRTDPPSLRQYRFDSNRVVMLRVFHGREAR
jgi:hypothetical protein